MKTKEELNALKEEINTLKVKLAELNEEELAQVAGGLIPPYPPTGQVSNEVFKGIYDGNSKTVNIELGSSWGSEKSENPIKEWESSNGETSTIIPKAD